ncbi:hypothetical protein ABPG77_002448 [Micractinium sp. CCAP 211/92]
MTPRPAVVLLAAVAAGVLAAGAGAAPQPAFSFADLGTGAAEPVNCSASEAMAGSWLEITEILNFTQYKSGADLSTVPDPIPFPYTLSATDNRAPGFWSSCLSKSPTAPEDCEGDDCNVYIEEWDVKWLEFATLNCYGSYPTPDAVNFFEDPQPPPGNVALAMTQQCKNYFYKAADGFDFFYSVTDEWGNKWALQTSPNLNLTTEEDWDAMVAQIEWPKGWESEKLPLNDTAVHTPYLVGDACYIPVLKDSSFNSWHTYEYPADGLGGQDSLFGAIGDGCARLDAKYTMQSMGAGAPTPSA